MSSLTGCVLARDPDSSAYYLHNPRDQHFKSFQPIKQYHIEPPQFQWLDPVPSGNEAESPHSACSTQSSRQLHPRLPLIYTGAVLMELHRRPQIRTLTNISAPFPWTKVMKRHQQLTLILQQRSHLWPPVLTVKQRIPQQCLTLSLMTQRHSHQMKLSSETSNRSH